MNLEDKRKLDYEQALETYRQFADIRFKLLAFVPALSGAAVALLTRANIERWEKVGIAGLGFFVTLGIVLYDQRNTQFYNGAITRAGHTVRGRGSDGSVIRFNIVAHFSLSATGVTVEFEKPRCH